MEQHFWWCFPRLHLHSPHINRATTEAQVNTEMVREIHSLLSRVDTPGEKNSFLVPSVFPYSVCPNAPDHLYSEPFNTHKTQNGLHVCHGMMVLSQGLDERSPRVFSQNLSVCESTQERVCTWAFFLTLPRICNWLLWDTVLQVSSSEQLGLATLKG